METEHKIMVEEEMEKAKLDMENELAEIQVRVSGAGGGRDVMKNLPGHLGVSRDMEVVVHVYCCQGLECGDQSSDEIASFHFLSIL